MSMPFGEDAWWWDNTWNPVGGCLSPPPGVQNCYAAQEAGTKTWPYAGSARVHDGVTIVKGKRRIFNGKLTAARQWAFYVGVAPPLARSAASEARPRSAIADFCGRHVRCLSRASA